MLPLASQRCLHHASREAVARCPECGQFFCRECIAEHDDRVICASCLRKIAQRVERPHRRRINVWPAAQIGGGFAFAWLFFYIAGRLLLSLPDDFHDDNLWKTRLMHAVGMREDE